MKKVLLIIVTALALAAPPAMSDPRCKGIDYANVRDALITQADWGNGDVYVNRSWYTLKIQDKESFAAYFGTCKSKHSFVRIYDGHTGKQLARWGKGWGYSNYEK